MERIGIYTGTFNPVHLGHLRAARYGLDALRLDKVLMIPDGISPHKKPLPESTATASQRLEMLEIALRGEEKIEASSLALQPGHSGYTVETVLAVRKQYPNAKLHLLLGSDMLHTFPNWKDRETITAQASLAVFCRGGKDELSRLEQTVRELEDTGAEVTLLQNPVTEISSTQLRRLLVFRCASEFLPEAVKTYIYQNKLYCTGENYSKLPEELLEKAVIGLLNPNRVRHVLGCRQAAVELARCHGADETDAARAALLHDVTKALDGPLQLTLCREYGTMLDAFSAKNPKTLHALTGSLVAEKIFEENSAVVEAICCHTTGKADMSLLEKIIYVADYMEPNRDFPGVEQLRELAFTDMDAALERGLRMTLEHLARQGAQVSPASQAALEYLCVKM
jgi:nicotinate-nucleotide adenylyltransferase